MSYDNFDYDYHELAANSDFIYDESDDYDDSFISNEDYWEDYYHNIVDELDDNH